MLRNNRKRVGANTRGIQLQAEHLGKCTDIISLHDGSKDAPFCAPQSESQPQYFGTWYPTWPPQSPPWLSSAWVRRQRPCWRASCGCPRCGCTRCEHTNRVELQGEFELWGRDTWPERPVPARRTRRARTWPSVWSASPASPDSSLVVCRPASGFHSVESPDCLTLWHAGGGGLKSSWWNMDSLCLNHKKVVQDFSMRQQTSEIKTTPNMKQGTATHCSPTQAVQPAALLQLLHDISRKLKPPLDRMRVMLLKLRLPWFTEMTRINKQGSRIPNAFQTDLAWPVVRSAQRQRAEPPFCVWHPGCKIITTTVQTTGNVFEIYLHHFLPILQKKNYEL